MVLASTLAFAVLKLLAGDSATAVAREPQAVLLASSKSMKTGVDAAERRRVVHTLAALQFGPVATVISPQELDAAVDSESPDSPDNQLLEVEVKARPPPRAQQEPLQSQIPFGLAAIVWGIRHPSEAWRIFLPIPSGTDRAQPGSHTATPEGRLSAGISRAAFRLP